MFTLLGFRRQRLKLKELEDDTGPESVVPWSCNGSGTASRHLELSCFLPFNLCTEQTQPGKRTGISIASYNTLNQLLDFAALESTAPSLFCANCLTKGQRRDVLGQQEVSEDKRPKPRKASLDFILIQSLVKCHTCGQSQNKICAHRTPVCSFHF